MKLSLFGATGRTGQYLLEHALEAGHTISVYARNPLKLTLEHGNLRVVQGEITDGRRVAEAISGADAVISTLGPVRGGPKDLLEISAKNIVAGMKQHGVRRLIFSTGAGVRAPEDMPGGMHKFIGFLLNTLSREVLEDSQRGVEIVKNSDLDWTIARGPMLQDASYNGKYRVGFVGNGMGRTLARGNFAHFMLEQVESDEWLERMPALSDE